MPEPTWILKIDEESKLPVFAEDGDVKKPIYIDPDGKELALDPPAMYQKIIDLGAENKKHREEKQTLRTSMELFDGIDDLGEWKTKADQALEKVANFNEKDWLAADKVQKLKDDIKDSYETQIKQQADAFVLKEESFTSKLSKKDEQIRRLMVDNKFATHPLFSGQKPKTNVLPAMAVDHFGKQFKIEENDKTGELSLIGHYANGDIVYSKEKPGEIADFREAMNLIFDAHPDKDAMLRGGAAGTGSRGGDGEGDFDEADELKKLEKEYAAAVEAKDAKNSVRLKNAIWNLKQKRKNAA